MSIREHLRELEHCPSICLSLLNAGASIQKWIHTKLYLAQSVIYSYVISFNFKGLHTPLFQRELSREFYFSDLLIMKLSKSTIE